MPLFYPQVCAFTSAAINKTTNTRSGTQMLRRRRVLADDAVAEDEVVHRSSAVERPPWSPAQLVAVILGIVFLIVGGISLARTGVDTNNMTAHFSNTPLW